MNYGRKRQVFLLILLFILHACNGQMKNTETKPFDRATAAAGSFYPKDPEILRSTLKIAFSKAKIRKPNREVFAIICPHAGYAYSAKVAASAFNQIDTTKSYEHIFVIGSSHRVQFDGASIYKLGDYVTPLGHIKMDTLGNELIKNKKLFSDIAAYVSGDLDPGLFVISGKLAEGVKMQDAENAIDLEQSLDALLNNENKKEK